MMTDSTSLLVLFDIDGTLILSGRAGVRGMNAAFRRLYGADGVLDSVPIAGRTDRAIVGDGLSSIGRAPTDTEIMRLRDAYLEELPLELPRPAGEPSCVLPGVGALLDALEDLPGVHVGLLTGNFERGAELKLTHFDLWRRFSFGAFGDHHLDRRALLPVAIERACAAGLPACPPERVVIIGDTPLDVDCARTHGARALAVATGHYDTTALEATGADLVVPTLMDTPRLVTWTITPPLSTSR
jgi:phosphoglycolate phosphatase